MAYVIVVHRAMDVRVAVRQGLQYLLATSGIRILQITISAGVIVLAATMGVTPRVWQHWWGWIAAKFALLVTLGAFAGRLRGWTQPLCSSSEAYEANGNPG